MTDQPVRRMPEIMKRTSNKSAELNKKLALKRLDLTLKRQSYRALGLTDEEIDEIFRRSVEELPSCKDAYSGPTS